MLQNNLFEQIYEASQREAEQWAEDDWADAGGREFWDNYKVPPMPKDFE